MNINVSTLPQDKRLNVIIALAGLTQAKVARAAGVSRQSISRWFSGEVEPTTSSYRKLEAAIKPHLEDLTFVDLTGGSQ